VDELHGVLVGQVIAAVGGEVGTPLLAGARVRLLDDESGAALTDWTETEVDGTFPISFTATPDRTVLQEDEPTFRYTVYADVTDTTGETRSDQKVINVGYTALKAGLSAADWQEKQTKQTP